MGVLLDCNFKLWLAARFRVKCVYAFSISTRICMQVLWVILGVGNAYRRSVKHNHHPRTLTHLHLSSEIYLLRSVHIY